MSTPTTEPDRDLGLASCVGRLEGIAEHLPVRLDGLERRMDGLERRMEAGFAELRQTIAAANEATNSRIEATNSRMDKQFRWLIGIQFGIIGLLVTILLKGG